jgi:hypothetical protein
MVRPRLIAPFSEAGDRCPGSHLFSSYFHVALHRALHRDVVIQPSPSHRGNDGHHINLAVFVSPTSASLVTFTAIAADAELIAATREDASCDYSEAGIRAFSQVNW